MDVKEECELLSAHRSVLLQIKLKFFQRRKGIVRLGSKSQGVGLRKISATDNESIGLTD